MKLDLEQPKIIFIIGLVFDLSDYVRRNQKTGSDKAWNNFWNPFKDVPNPVLRISWNFFGKCPIPFMKFIVKINSAGAQSRFYLYDIISVWNWGFGTARMSFRITNSYLLEKSLKIDVWDIRDGNSLKNLLCKLFLLVPNLNLCLIKSSHYRTILGNFWNPFQMCPIQFC